MVKLTDYCLNPNHLRGRHKARVFASALGLTAGTADELRDALLQAARSGEAVPADQDQYGQRFVVDLRMTRLGKSADIRSTWIVRVGEDFPRLTSCYVV